MIRPPNAKLSAIASADSIAASTLPYTGGRGGSESAGVVLQYRYLAGDKMNFDSIDLNKNGNITFSLKRWARNTKPFVSIVHVAVAGDYRPGSSGNPDAQYVRGTVHTIDGVWRPSAMILDLRDLRYEWGDNMVELLDVPKDILAIIVGPKCEPAISTLFYGVDTTKSVLDEPYYFDAFDPALEYAIQALTNDWNSKVEQRPEWFSESDKITTDELRRRG